MQLSGQTETALRLALKVWNEAASDSEAAILAREVLSADVPRWHFYVVRDRVRNAAYDAALRSAIRPHMRVLDIGSGTGLLALMAARAGAEQVFSCEMSPAVADAAREIVALNGYADKIQVLSKHSGEIEADSDLGGRVDLIVSEVVSNTMLSEGVLATMEYAVKNFLKPGGRVVPAKGTVRAALGFDPRAAERRMETTDGFDLTPFNRLAKPRYSIPTTDARLQLRSEATDLFEFDFRAAEARTEARAQWSVAAFGGPVNCIAQWIHLQIDEEVSYENRPGVLDFSNWETVIFPISKEIPCNSADSITINASHDLNNLRIWASAG
jgi:SAM-dependent methyltransferase